ncbi:MAG: FAD-dependent thymidylate synthase [Candidatus Yonathbacteria bacterium]|nr:FAD-dependent thymidylate synthase [Candidatus Yonathbacteria bacterium]
MKSLSMLNHLKYQLPDGGKVILLDNGAVIDAEAGAMLQALHSRSAKGIENHLLILEEKGAEKFMESFYVGYGHKSIGDCGSIDIFIEGVSMLVAKAIQDNQLYSGQEASTRYIDFAEQEFRDPVGTSLSGEILEAWRSFYVNSKEELLAHLRAQFPRKETENEATYEKAIAARSFDILRGFLPAGATTNLAWHTNLRQAADNLCWLRNHPLREVRDVAQGIQAVLAERYPSSFSHKTYPASEAYYAEMMNGKYFEGLNDIADYSSPDGFYVESTVSPQLLLRYRKAIESRPPKTDLPKILSECGLIHFSFPLDFGSFRDIQRHRAVIQQMPLLATYYGFEEWYLQELPDVLQSKASVLLDEQQKKLFMLSKGDFGVSKKVRQYYVAMGYRTPNRVTGGLPALVYLVELRATRFVHPTLRRRAKQMAEFLQANFGKHGLVLHLDQDPDRFDIKRGEHDIQLKEKAV